MKKANRRKFDERRSNARQALICVCHSVILCSINRMIPPPPFSTVETTVVDNGDGRYSVSYTPKEPGVYSVWVCVKAHHVKVQK